MHEQRSSLRFHQLENVETPRYGSFGNPFRLLAFRLLAFQMLLLEHISTPAGIDLLLEKFSANLVHRLNAAVAA